MRIAYLFSRYPVVSQTFCDTEILALEKRGVDLELYSIYPPPTSFRHGHAARMRAPIHYAPAASILKIAEARAKKEGRWPEKLIAEHDRLYGKDYKAALRARNALYFAELFKARGITHFHVHFANRAAHTAIFIKALSGIPFSISTHGQDFMVDLGNDQLLAEICREAEFIANETEFSKGLVRDRAPDSAAKMLRVFNGMDLANFPKVPLAPPADPGAPVKIVSTGRLIEFKGFHHLIAACRVLQDHGLNFECEIIGEGPWRARLQALIEKLGVQERVRLLGSLPQEEVFGKLRGCDIFTLPCIIDSQGASDVFPTVILEAMASSRPVVSTHLAGVPEQIDNEVTGLLVESGNEADLAWALGRLIASPELRRQFGEAARLRIENEFAVERTVVPLEAMFKKFVPPNVAPARVLNGWVGLLERWPGQKAADDRHELDLRELAAAFPAALKVYVLGTGEEADPKTAPALVRHLEFLPDAMVVEGEWQQDRETARRMETWRVDLGQKLPTELFLQAARQALYLRGWLKRDGVRHVHAMGRRELLTAWMLKKLLGISISVTVDERDAPLPESVLAQLLGDCAGIRFSTEKSALALLQAHQSDPGQFVLQHKPRKGFENEWLACLGKWGSVR